jgi:lysine 6-dehydrogenase
VLSNQEVTTRVCTLRLCGASIVRKEPLLVKRFAILGSGRQGGAVAAFLLERFTDVVVDFVDRDAKALESALALQPARDRVHLHRLPVVPVEAPLREVLRSAACVVSCVPYALNLDLTRAAIEEGVAFCDLGGNVDTVQAQVALANECRARNVAIAPDCGLAPGLLNVLAEYWSRKWTYRDVRLYCGGLPQNPQGPLKYALTFNVCGLLNEYFDDCEVSRGGELATVPGMSEPEALDDLAIPGNFEAFATSGGASLAAREYAGAGIDYQYKTIRYPGHRDLVCAMRDSGFFDRAPLPLSLNGERVSASPWDLSGAILTHHLPSDRRDLVVARVDVVGEENGARRCGRIDLVDFAVDRFTAMERTTGFPTAIVAAALADLYPEHPVRPGAWVPYQILPPEHTIHELARGGINGITIREI